MEKFGRLTRWATGLFGKKAVAAVAATTSELALPVFYADEMQTLNAWHRFQGTRSCGQPVRMKTHEMSSHSVVFRSDRELNLGEQLTVTFGPIEVRATVVHVHPTFRTFGGELELTPTPGQREELLGMLAGLTEIRPEAPQLVAHRPKVRKTGPSSRSLRRPSSDRLLQSATRSVTGGRRVAART